MQIVPEWPPVAWNCTRVTASRMQIVPEWPPVAWNCTRATASHMKLYPSDRQSHANCTRVAASRMQILPAWPPVACKFRSILFMLHGAEIKYIFVPLKDWKFKNLSKLSSSVKFRGPRQIVKDATTFWFSSMSASSLLSLPSFSSPTIFLSFDQKIFYLIWARGGVPPRQGTASI
jgi:hypothetical protein